MIKFDNIEHRVTVAAVTVKLQPLSFKLLERLAATPNVSVAVADIEQAVWGDVTVGPETLKQRIFVLRRSLADAGVSHVSIQAVRGEGYRLILDPGRSSSKKSRMPRWVIPAAVIALAVLAVFSYAQYTKPAYAPVNNRMVLWTNMALKEMPPEAARVYEAWRSMLTAENMGGDLQLIFSSRSEDIPLPFQARQSRAALVSFFELVQHEGQPAIRLHVIEPVTATVLRSDIIKYKQHAEAEQLMQGQRDGILALLGSGKLYLDAEQRKNARAPIWQELRRLANPS